MMCSKGGEGRLKDCERAYILAHGVSGIDWAYYKHPLPEYAYDTYMRYCGDVTFK